MTHIQEVILRIEKVDLKTEDAIQELHKIIETELKRLPMFLTDIVVGEPLVRALYLPKEEEYHYKIQDYSYNPYLEKIKLGRANYKGQQVFYGARYRETALKEVRFMNKNKEEDMAKYSLGRWEPKRKIQLAAIVTPEVIRHHNATELFGLADFIEQKEKELRNDPDLSGFIELYRYMATKYVELIEEGEEYKYKITATFSNFVYSKLHIADGIIYQSVQCPKNFNIALKKEVVVPDNLLLTFAARQIYERTGPMSFKEINSVQTTNIDYDNNKVNW